MKEVAILGSTGSIGTNTLDVIRSAPGRFRVSALAAGGNLDLLESQVREFSPPLVSVRGPEEARRLKPMLKGAPEILWGVEGLLAAAVSPARDGIVVAAIPGIRTLRPVLAAIASGRAVALASKEVLVAAGDLVMAAAREKGTAILPVDSEHSGIFQCLRGVETARVARIILTASGGPFLTAPRERLKTVTPEEAVAHPRWKMGRKVSLDSATLMNKGLEVIEAGHLFGLPVERIEVAVHPQSLVHALVELVDGAQIAQLAKPDMRLPIAYALNFPERIPPAYGALDIREAGTLTFSRPDLERFPCLGLAYRAGREGGTLPAVLNAANEEAGEAFLGGRIGFLDIPFVVEGAMSRHRPVSPVRTLEDVVKADAAARRVALTLIQEREGER